MYNTIRKVLFLHKNIFQNSGSETAFRKNYTKEKKENKNGIMSY